MTGTHSSYNANAYHKSRALRVADRTFVGRDDADPGTLGLFGGIAHAARSTAQAAVESGKSGTVEVISWEVAPCVCRLPTKIQGQVPGVGTNVVCTRESSCQRMWHVARLDEKRKPVWVPGLYVKPGEQDNADTDHGADGIVPMITMFIGIVVFVFGINIAGRVVTDDPYPSSSSVYSSGTSSNSMKSVPPPPQTAYGARGGGK